MQRVGFDLDVRVYDGKHAAHTRVHVVLRDENDNAPTIGEPRHFTLDEAGPVGARIGRLSVVDPDFGGRDEHM